MVTTIGFMVIIIAEFIGRDKCKPYIKQSWLQATPKTASIINFIRWGFCTFSFSVKKESVQNKKQAPLTRITTKPAGPIKFGIKSFAML